MDSDEDIEKESDENSKSNEYIIDDESISESVNENEYEVSDNSDESSSECEYAYDGSD